MTITEIINAQARVYRSLASLLYLHHGAGHCNRHLDCRFCAWRTGQHQGKQGTMMSSACGSNVDDRR